MKSIKRLCALLLCVLLLSPAAVWAAPARGADAEYHFDADFSSETLGQVIERYLAERQISDKNIAIGWMDLTSGEEWYYNGDLFMEGASTYKLPLSMVYADKVLAGELKSTDKIGHYVLEDALYEMLVNSNNSVALRLRDNLTRDFAEYRRMLVPYSGLEADSLPSGYYTNNQFSPRFLIGTLHTLYERRDEFSNLLDYMKEARPDTLLSQYRGKTEVAHKYGSDENFVSDSGIIFARHPFLMTVMTHNVGDAMRRIGELGRIAMDYAEYLASLDPPEPESEPVGEELKAPLAADGVREISDAETLRAIRYAPEDDYRIVADIDLGGADWEPIPFFGHLDGGGHTLYNLTVRAPGAETAECRDGNNNAYDAVYAGLFSTVREAEIRDLTLKGVYVDVESSGNCYIAALAGYAYDLTCANVSVEGRVHLYAHGKIVGVGGVVGFGSGWFTDCDADVELVFEDRNETLHCEMFLGGLVASGKFTAERCTVDIQGYGSVNGFVHTGGLTGMYCGYGLVRDRMMRITDCTVRGKIRFFEHNFTRRAYCRGIAGEQVDLLINLNNDIRGFGRDEHRRYDVILRPEMCSDPVYRETVTAPTCTEWGHTEHVCESCGYSWIDSYTPPRHSPGEWTLLTAPDFGVNGERAILCTVCGTELEHETLPALIRAESIELSQSELTLRHGEEAVLTAAVLPADAEKVSLRFTSSDESVASVDENGTVRALGKGTAEIVCAADDGSLRAVCTVTVSYPFFQRLADLFR